MSEESKMLPKSVEASPTLKVMPSCLRSHSENHRTREPRKVSFPEEDDDLVTGYLEPANPWEYAENVSREDLISTYRVSCEKHGTFPLPHLLDQLQTLDIDAARSEFLDLKGQTLCSIQCETLEEVLKRVQFKNIDLEATSLDDEGSVALFDMVEYYESAVQLNISGNENIGVRGWQACSRMIKRTHCLEYLEARNVTLNEQYMPILSRALRITTQLQVLKLENCNLSGRPVIILAAALKWNTSLRELYLADNDLEVTDAIQLGGLLRGNFTLQLLDISNNNIQDAGLGHISDGLTDQTPDQPGSGLSILVLWNNHLTRNASKHFARAVARSKTLETLNIGQNMLTNECLHVIKNSLQQNRTLLQLGMQSTHLTCEGAIALAECIEDNPVIQRIDLRDNCLKVAGLMALALALKVNTSVTQLDLDDVPKKKLEEKNALDQYVTLVTEIRGYCARNETALREGEDVVEEGPATGAPGKGRIPNSTSRKISLTCETLLRTTAMPPQPTALDSGLLAEPRRGSSGRLRSPAPSPIPSPISSPTPSPSRTRFQVSRVAESSSSSNAGQSLSPSFSSSPVTSPSMSSSPSRFFPSPSTSRFRVTLVEPSASSPTVTSPSGNITVGFTFKKSIADKTDDENDKVPKDLAADTETAPGMSVACSTVASHSTAVMTQHASLSQNVKVTVKFVPSSDSLIIENESSPSVTCDTSEDTADMEVRTIMGGSSWVTCGEQDSVILLRGAGGDMAVGSDKDVSTQFPFLGISNDKTLVDQLSSVESVCVTEESSEPPTCSVKSCDQVGNSSGTVELADRVGNTLGTLMASNVMDKSLCTVKPEGQLGDDNFGTEKLVEQVDNSDTVAAKEHVDDSLCVMKTDDHVDNSLGTMKLVACVDKTSGTVELDEYIHNNISSQNFDEQTNSFLRAGEPNSGDDNSLSTMKPAEWIFNDLSTMTPDGQVDKNFSSLKWDEGSCSLEQVLKPLEPTLKQPGQVDNSVKEMPHCTLKVSWAATVNAHPVANGESVLLSSAPSNSFGHLEEDVPSQNATQEVKTSVKQNPGESRKEGKISNCDNPIPDILNNNKKIKEVTLTDSLDENRLKLERQEESGCNTRLCEDENYNVPKLHETISEGESNESVSETVRCRSVEVGTTTGANKVCDSKCNFSLNDSEDGSMLEDDDTGACPESFKLAGNSDITSNTSECTAKGSDTRLNIESKNSPTNGVNVKPVACWKWDSDQFGVSFGNGSVANGRLSNDKSWSRSFDSSFVSVKNAAATVQLMGSSSEFSSCEMDAHRGPGAGSLLLPDHSVGASVQPSGKEMEPCQGLELYPSNTI